MKVVLFYYYSNRLFPFFDYDFFYYSNCLFPFFDYDFFFTIRIVYFRFLIIMVLFLHHKDDHNILHLLEL